MEPGAEIKFARVYTRAEFKFRPRLGACRDKISRCSCCFGKGTASKTRLLDYLRSTNYKPHRRDS
ncbi:hypothetical protein [uncultured Campylobacter sp.]|uniref:hypothetical protein n=1 Tax=uncultured Campylobacter sp. TaxID=218934 RepID=UPI00261C7F8F|nr:hypothetical protein [uncultured Campylobacter sp.]